MIQQPTQVPLDLPLTITMSVADFNTVISALNELPYKKVAPLLSTMYAQADARVADWLHEQAPKPVPPAPPEPEVIKPYFADDEPL